MDERGQKVVLHEGDVQRALTRIAHEIAERNPGAPPALIGIHRRGAFLAQRLQRELERLFGCEVPIGDLDIGFYRDDVASRPEAPILHASHIDFDVSSRTLQAVEPRAGLDVETRSFFRDIRSSPRSVPLSCASLS